MILTSNLKKTCLLELNAYLMQQFEKRINDNLLLQQNRNEQLLALLNKPKEELLEISHVN